MEKRDWLERRQIAVYAAALAIGIAAGLLGGGFGRSMGALISPLLAVLLYGMFTMVPFLKLRQSLANGRFIAALVIANFIVAPLVVWGLLALFPQPAAVTIGVCLVLLTPCIDYVIVFTGLGKGDEKAILAATPVLFVVQMALLPLYLTLFAGPEAAGLMRIGPFIEAFMTLIVLPLAAALLTQFWARGGTGTVEQEAEQGAEPGAESGGRAPLGVRVLDAAAWIPVPFMALVLIAVTASQIGRIAADLGAVLRVLPVYALFLLLMPPLARLTGRLLKLDAGSGRALIFSAFTRNSLVVLPLALSLPGEAAGIAAAVIVTQTMTELVGELVYVRAVPRWLWKEKKRPAA
ncbi:arsenic resistance protein [Saccharibacillus sp. CPCC 101409]|uniref:arsenic resistance protein n=1 Tax=Saccharibacillus sp. CPCC 101409 TaxID=3058041 RepID=UPI002673AFF4|nr:arsenic resistance protein [Saccharibacillus sp. CPCC 101409]MDO3411211.1 arsenic resistance protein [Saccharibacillus sp. CPCC 101409]